jgi:flagellar basal body-associated protein FliL
MESEEKNKSKIQTISITLIGVIGAAINGIVGYIAVYFFKPLWEKLIKKWNKNE